MWPLVTAAAELPEVPGNRNVGRSATGLEPRCSGRAAGEGSQKTTIVTATVSEAAVPSVA